MKRALGFMNKIPPIDAWDGLVSLYKLDETSGTIAYDSFGTTNLTNSGITINQSGKLGQAYASTNTNQNLSASGVTAITNDFSLNLWCYQTTAPMSGNCVLAENGDYGNGFGIWVNPTNEITFFLNLNYNKGWQAHKIPTLNAWDMITLTCVGTTFKLYHNAILLHTETISYSGNTATTRRMFNRTNNSEAFLGRLDNVSFFNKALTQAQITAHYNGGNGITL